MASHERSSFTCPETVVSELIPVLAATGGISAVVVVVCILRGWSIARALALLLATVTAIVTRKDERRETCLELVDMVTRRDDPPVRLRRRPVRVIAQPPETSTSSVAATPPAIPELPGTSADDSTFTK
jgi:hypothetical protein